jgi:Holliday junction resolvasome RuvABC endonuclease subunit
VIILGLDLATRTGWAVVKDGRVIESGVQDFSKRRGESNGVLFLRARKWLSEFGCPTPPHLVVYEQAHFRGGAATEICVGLQTRAQEMAAEWGIESAPVPTSTLKKWATGVGRAEKAAMIAWAAERIGRQPEDDNEADAIAVGLWAAEEFEVRRQESGARSQ